MFEYKTTIRLRDTDAAGVMYFARQFELVHEAYEAFMAGLGFGLGRILRDETWFLAIVHAESDYLAPLRVGDQIRISLGIERLGKSSYTIRYELSKDGKRSVGTARTVHVAVSRKMRRKLSLPRALAGKLAQCRIAK
ncbi:MAG: acyl-CoA thioesterase [Candidatus Hydrogenedentes bacterium]|nr:acyl-CoA thioesterase [Candidatus Hydrogenedentota bacterium]